MELTYLREIFEGCKSCHVAFPVQDCDGKISGLDQLQDPRVGVNSVENVVLSDLDEVDDLVAVVRVGPADNDPIMVEFIHSLVLVSFKVWIHFGNCLRN